MLGERFDIVLFLGLLYHLRHPLLALDLLHEHAVKDLLVFQSLLRGDDHVEPVEDDYPFWETEVFARASFPRLHFIEKCFSGDPTIGRRVSQLVQLADRGEHPIPIHRHLRSLPAVRRGVLAILAENGADKTRMTDERPAAPLAELERASGRAG